MQVRITRMSVLQNAKLMAVLYVILSIPIVVIMLIASMFSPNSFGGGMLLLFPVFYGVGGFIFSAIAVALYNLSARLVGGLEYTTEVVG